MPGFGLSLGYTRVFLTLTILIPLSAVFLKPATLNRDESWAVISSPRVRSANTVR